MRLRAVLPMLLPMLLIVAGGGVLGPRGAEDAGAQPNAPAGGGASRSDLETAAPPRGLPVEQERDPGRGPTPHEPVFLEPAATSTEHVRYGLSAWIAPGPPFDRHENPGGPAIGFTITSSPPVRPGPASGPSPWRGSAAR